MLKIKTMPRTLPRFPTTSEIFPLKMARQWYHLTPPPRTQTLI